MRPRGCEVLRHGRAGSWKQGKIMEVSLFAVFDSEPVVLPVETVDCQFRHFAHAQTVSYEQQNDCPVPDILRSVTIKGDEQPLQVLLIDYFRQPRVLVRSRSNQRMCEVSFYQPIAMKVMKEIPEIGKDVFRCLARAVFVIRAEVVIDQPGADSFRSTKSTTFSIYEKTSGIADAVTVCCLGMNVLLFEMSLVFIKDGLKFLSEHIARGWDDFF